MYPAKIDATNRLWEDSLQTLARETPPEERQHVLEALEAIQRDSFPPEGTSERWATLLQQISILKPEKRHLEATRTREIVARIFARRIDPSLSIGHLDVFSNPLLHLVIDLLPPQSRCMFARTCRLSRTLVRGYREERVNRFLAFPGFQPLISQFCQNVPDLKRPETFDQWQHELLSEVIPILLESLLSSSIPTEAEKGVFRAHSEGQIASDPQLLHQLFFASYQLSLIILALRGSWIDSVTIAKIDMRQPISQSPSLREKAETAATLIQLHANRLFTIMCDESEMRARERMTCLPREILSLRVQNLFLSGHLIRVLPQEICCLGRDLQRLDLSQNRIKHLPRTFFILSNLQQVRVDEPLRDQILKQIQQLPGLRINGELANPGLCDMLSEVLSEISETLPSLGNELLAFAINLWR